MEEMTNAEVWEEMSAGDKIQYDGKAATQGAHTVVGDEPSGPMRAVEGPGGASKMMVQNANDPNSISIMSMGNRNDHGTWMKNIRIVGSED